MTTIATVAPFALLGLVLGVAHFKGLAMQVQALTRRGSVIAVVLPLARFAVTAAGLFFAARAGVMPLLAAALGFLTARFLAPRLYPRRA